MDLSVQLKYYWNWTEFREKKIRKKQLFFDQKTLIIALLTHFVGGKITTISVKGGLGVVHILRNHFWASWATPPPYVIL